MTHVLLELTLILVAIGPVKVSIAVHFIIEPLSGVLLPVDPIEDAMTLFLIHLKLTFIDCAIGVGLLTVTILLTIKVFTLVNGTVRPCLLTKSLLVVIPKLANILRAICTTIRSGPIGLIIPPIASVHITIGMN